MEKQDFYRHARHDKTGPYDGLVVIEVTTSWAGPMAGCLLADFGARVIKVEHPMGEVMRRLPLGFPGSKLMIQHETVNRNKQNVSLNLQTPAGREVFLKLCAKADVVIENFRPGTLSSWGVGYGDVAKIKPDIVYVSISGFGQFGPLSDRACYDPIAQSYCGWTSLNGDPDGGPMKAPTFLGDDLAGLHGALGAMAALRHRDQTGEGQHVDVSLIDSLLHTSNGHLTAGALGLPIPKTGNEYLMATPVNEYRCTNGHVFTGMLLDSHWAVLAPLMGHPELAHMKVPERLARRAEVNRLVSEWCSHQTVESVVETLAAHGIAATRINTFQDVAGEAHVAARDMLQTVRLSDGTEAPLTGPSIKFSRTPTRIRNAAPPVGQHNAEILAELGYSQAEIERLISEQRN
ncbi:MAG TPA: CoA transferase [Steroidobacter sp.]|uniref:CaiB/BaiF CoA transferase family protein n=1 Tax=Steroidobacter sp. TaxID=1978227 RepID=UPI002EDAB253